MSPSARVRRAFLHVGTPKAGSTYLQGVLWGNREELERAGVGLPGVGAFEHYRASRDVRGVPFDPHEPGGDGSGSWDALARKARRRRESDIIISDEQLGALPVEGVGRVSESLAPRELHVVLVLRPLASVLPSAWQEVVKHRGTEGYPDWVGRVLRNKRRPFWRHHDPAEVLGRWSAFVPRDRIHIVTAPSPPLGPGELWVRFATVLGVDPAQAVNRDFPRNASLGYAETEFLRRLNAELPLRVERWHYAMIVRELLADATLRASDRETKPALPSEFAGILRQRQAQIVEAVAASGCRVVGSLDEFLTATTGPSAPPPASDAVLDVSLHAAAGLVEELARRQDQARGTVATQVTEKLTRLPVARTMLASLEGRSASIDRALAARGRTARSRIRGA